MRTVLFIVFLAVFIIALSNIATIVERGNGIPDVFQVLFPEKFVDTEAQIAAETKTAPFAAAEQAAEPVELDPEIEYDPLGGEVALSEALELPHRHEAAVSEWVSEAVGDALSFSLAGVEDHIVKVDAYMSPSGMEEYKRFLEQAKVLALMQSRNYELRAFVTDIPRTAGAGVARGRYRWVYDVPVNLTFLPVGTTSYEDLGADEYVTETVTIRTQLGRVAENGGKDGIEIETWEALRRGAR